MPLIVPSSSSVEADGFGTPGTLLHAGQLMLGDVVLGSTDDYGVEWVLERLSGWDSPASTGTVEQRANDHGGWLSPAFYAPRIIEVEGSLLAASWAAASRALDRLLAAVPLSTPATLYVAEADDRTLQADVRQEGQPLAERVDGWARFSLSLIAPDPRKYGTELVRTETGLPQTTGGMGLPLALPLTIGATVASGVLTATNEGNVATRPILRVYGPSPAFQITHRNSGRTLQYHDSVPAGRFLEIDTDKRRALLDGTAARVVTGSWFEYEPGDNEVALSASTYDPDARLVSEHRSAWR